MPESFLVQSQLMYLPTSALTSFIFNFLAKLNQTRVAEMQVD